MFKQSPKCYNDDKITEIHENYTNILSSVKTYNPSALNKKSAKVRGVVIKKLILCL